MTIAERNQKLKHLITCLKCEVSGKCCDDNCPTQYEAGNMGEIIENLEAISKALEQEPILDKIIEIASRKRGKRMNLNATREEFENLKFFNPTIDFTSVVIIPTKQLHDSGYRCMKYALINTEGEVVGCIGGECDVIHLNGIGGYGKYGTYDWDISHKGDITKRIAWCIDCLPNGLIRVFCSRRLDIDDIICSDFNLYLK